MAKEASRSATQRHIQLPKAAVVVLLLIASTLLSFCGSHVTRAAFAARQEPCTSRGLEVRLRVCSLAAAAVTPATPSNSLGILTQTPEPQPYPTLKQYASEHCMDLSRAYSRLLDINLGPLYESWPGNQSAEANSGASQRLYIKRNRLYVDSGAFKLVQQQDSLPAIFGHLRHLQSKAILPDVALSGQAAASPENAVDEELTLAPHLSFCSKHDYCEVPSHFFLQLVSLL